MPTFNQPSHLGLQKMQNMQSGDQYRTRSLYDIINLLHLANPKMNKKDLLLQMLQRDLDVGNNEVEFSKAMHRNNLDVQQREQFGVPANMPFTPGTLWM